MNPFFFGTRQRRLFGVYAPPLVAKGAPRAVLICQPWGQEYLRAHRSLRLLSTMLNKAGFHVLRFDYFGTGDAGGNMADADIPGWESDIGTAMDELKDMTGATRLTLVGLRLGATLAARACAGRRDVNAAVLWDPVVSGSAYVDELLQASTATAADGSPEVLGFPLTRTLADQARALDLCALLPALPRRSLIVTTLAPAPGAGLHAALAAQPTAALEQIDSQPAWVEDRDSGAGAVPVKVLQRITEWLA